MDSGHGWAFESISFLGPVPCQRGPVALCSVSHPWVPHTFPLLCKSAQVGFCSLQPEEPSSSGTHSLRFRWRPDYLTAGP